MSNYKKIWECTANSVESITRYIDSFSGDDLLGDGTEQKPFKSITRALGSNPNFSYYFALNGIFTETLTNISVRYLSSKFGQAILDGQNTFQMEFAILGVSNYGFGIIVINNPNASNASSPGIYHSLVVNTKQLNNNSTSAGYPNIIHKATSIYMFANRNIVNHVYKDIPLQNVTSNSGTSTFTCSKSIFDNCEVLLTKPNNTSNFSYDTCLFRVNCKFYGKDATNTMVRIDSDGMTSAQKQAAIVAWQSNDANKSATEKFIPFVNCRFTDNKILHVSDDPSMVGKDLNYYLIWGPEADYPACYMDNGKHIGVLPPAIKITPTLTANLTADPFELEIKPEHNLNIDAFGNLSINESFAGCSLISKEIRVPDNFNFMGISFSFLPGTEQGKRIIATAFDDFLDLSDTNKITVTPSTTLTPNLLYKSYYVKVPNKAVDYAIYNNQYYFDGDVITAFDITSPISANSDGTVYLYPMFRPSLLKTLSVKIFPIDRPIPSDFISDNNKFPWIPVESFYGNNRYTFTKGTQVLRDGNIPYGAMSKGTDNRILTTGHPESMTYGINTPRARFNLGGKRIVFKIDLYKI